MNEIKGIVRDAIGEGMSEEELNKQTKALILAYVRSEPAAQQLKEMRDTLNRLRGYFPRSRKAGEIPGRRHGDRRGGPRRRAEDHPLLRERREPHRGDADLQPPESGSPIQGLEHRRRTEPAGSGDEFHGGLGDQHAEARGQRDRQAEGPGRSGPGGRESDAPQRPGKPLRRAQGPGRRPLLHPARRSHHRGIPEDQPERGPEGLHRWVVRA